MSTILVVDDVRTDRELIGSVVSSSGNQPAYASDGEDALTKARELKPSLILLDVIMPRLDGFGACRRLKADKDTAGIPIVLITHKRAPSDRYWGQKQGAEDHLGKPFTPQQLLVIIKRYAP